MCHRKHLLAAFGAALVTMQISVTTVTAECLKDVQISSNKSATMLRIDWRYECLDIKEFKVYYRQLRYMACDQNILNQKQHTKHTMDNVIVLEELSPYSEYYIEIKAIKQRKLKESAPRPEKFIDKGYTLGTLPEVRLKKSSIRESIELGTNTSLTFSWGSPTDCTSYNGPLGGLYYEITGDQQKRSDNLTIDETKVTIDGLEPFTSYEFRVYVTNEERKYNKEFALVLSQATEGTKPPPPTDLSASIDNYEFVISWKSPDPPRGQLSHYLLHWKEDSSNTWKPAVTLQHTTSCPEIDTDCSTTLKMQDTTKNYTFQIKAQNEGVSESSYWSDAFHYIGSAGESMDNGGVLIIIVLGVIVGLLLIAVIVVIWKCRRKRYDGVLKYDPDKLPPYNFDRKDRVRDTTRTELSIISCSSGDSGVVTQGHTLNKLSQNGKDTNPYKVVDIIFPDKDSINTPSNRRSFHDRPLPLRPGEEEPIYTCIPDKDKDSEEVYLAPKVASMESLDDDGYLRPNYMPKQEQDREESDEEYLKPNFNRPERINTQDTSPDREFRPAIPITSYHSNDCLDSATKTHKVLQSAV